MKKQQLIWIIVAVVIALVIAVGIFLMAESPRRVLKSSLKDLESHRIEKVMDRVDENLTDQKIRSIEKDLQKIINAESVSTEITSDEAWRLKDDVQTPTKKYLASNYRATVTITLDEIPYDVTFRLRRQGATDEFKIFSFLFKPWVITNVKIEN